MFKIILVFIIAIQFITGCSINPQSSLDSNQTEYAKIEYVDEPASELNKIGSIMVMQRGNKFDIEKSLPLIQKKAWDIYGDYEVKITNITSSKFSNDRDKVSFADCNQNRNPQFQSKEESLAHHLTNGPTKPCSVRSKSLLNSDPYLVVTADILN